MADFFTRLAERALGLAPVAQPDLPSIFAPALPLEVPTQTSAWPESARAERSTADAAPVATRKKARPSTQPAPPMPRRFYNREITHQLVNVREGKDEPAQTSVPLGDEDISLKPRSGQMLDDIADREQVRRDTDRAVPRAISRERTLIQSNRSVISNSESSPLTRVDGSAPTIQVSIGKVEVRAVTPAAPASRAVERKAPPLLSLDQYLQQRNEGRR